MTHEFSQVPKEFGPGLVECPPQSNFNLFEMQIKPELRCAIEDSGEDVDMEYMMEMSFECDNGSDAVCVYFKVFFVGYHSLLKFVDSLLFTCNSQNFYLIST